MYHIERVRNKLLEKYKSVYSVVVDDNEYLYRLLTKLEYELMDGQVQDELDLQDAIVATCVLYPENLDIDNEENLVIKTLAETIVANSYIRPEDRLIMLDMFNNEMKQLDNIMCCLIMRAFPSYKLDEIENMEYPDFYRLYTRAEWYLVNVLQEPLIFSPTEIIKTSLYGEDTSTNADYYSNGHDEENEEGSTKQDLSQEEHQEGKYMGRKLSEVMNEMNNSSSKRKPMTEEQQRELDKFRQQFPDIQMEQDAMYTGELLSQKAGVISREATRKKY